MVAQLTGARFEATADDEQELRDYLLSCVEDHCQRYGRMWVEQEFETMATSSGFWGRIIIRRTVT